MSTVFITGAAAGIGRATALAYAAKGYTVGGYDIDTVGLETLADEITAAGGTAYTGHLDVTDYDEMSARITEFTAAAAGRLDIFINNAGVLIGGRFEELDVQLGQAQERHAELEDGVIAAEREVWRRTSLFAELAREREGRLLHAGVRHWIKREHLAFDIAWQRVRSDEVRGSGIVLGLAWYDL